MWDVPHITLQTRLNEPIGNNKRVFPGHSVSKPSAMHHQKKHVGTLFMSIDTFILLWRTSHIKGDISRLETYWIYNLRMFTPFGLNIERM